MDLNIAGNSALVTASSSGLGKASAEALARDGANVVINGRHEDRLEDARENIEAAATGDVVAQPGDITDADDIAALVDTAVDEFGGLDHLVTSAGGPPSGLLADTTDEDWYDAFDLLVMSVVRIVREARPHLQSDGGGSIVTITSGTVKEASDAIILSNSVRMAVIGLGKTLSKELAPEVRVNSVLPGTHESPRIQELIQDAVERGDYDSYDEGLRDREQRIPVGRIGQPIDLGNMVAFLSSEQAGYINGVAIQIDGGDHASNL